MRHMQNHFTDLFLSRNPVGKMTMTKMWSCGVEYNITGQGFDPTNGQVQRVGMLLPNGVNSNRDLGVCLAYGRVEEGISGLISGTIFGRLGIP